MEHTYIVGRLQRTELPQGSTTNLAEYSKADISVIFFPKLSGSVSEHTISDEL